MMESNSEVIESISEFVDDSVTEEITAVYADKRCYDVKYIRNYLRNNGIACYIPHKSILNLVYPRTCKTRFVVERYSLPG